MAIYFTADTHFLHSNIIRYTNRPFEDTKQMNQALVNNWNSVVDKNDEVYHLGDVALGKYSDADHILHSLNGKKYLIRGNHEKTVLRKEYTRYHFEWIKDYYELTIEQEQHPCLEVKKQLIILMHYPLASWRSMHRGTYMLHGHCHNTYKPVKGKILDVGVDNPLCNYTPISLDQVVQYMQTRKFQVVDQHKPRNNKSK